MNTVFNIIVIVQVLSALTIIGLVLLQHGKGADMGAAFGSGASGSLFGATGSSNFLSKSTGAAAALFFIATLALVYLGNHRSVATGGVMDNLPAATAPAAPAASAPAAAADAAIPGTSAPAVAPAPAAASGSASAAASVPAPATGSAQSNQIPK
ncbi:preprotein translocase subunit SecG [Collimonas pratensis]|uniref:Protein-export membrane protein SecG n=1 Tax=Collimonas pratensis TaxID=279113 RepID=A0A127Q330_9BURK|nr:preprotein translocase subunit SecG [Collimonas pratensis]AMP04449.1 preprotein translocase, SecG subunit [Collimonas pratensis]NKI69890.1 preprotein translocase subunit SecG [Collimonas pratensis]